MREAARAKAGFFPAPKEALDAIVKHFTVPSPGDCHILDPCAGEGAAILQIAASLGIDERKIWCVELDGSRGQKIKELMPFANVLTPASLFGCNVGRRAYSMIYCNPPFDGAVGGGGRIETQFLDHCIDLLVPNGVLLFACPEHMLGEWRFRSAITRMFHTIAVTPWPSPVRHHREVFITAIRRESTGNLGSAAIWRKSIDSPYVLPAASGPGQSFAKTQVIDEELVELMAKSPVREHMLIRSAETANAPPLALNTGHIALLLSSGHLNGVIRPSGELPHVVRGTARKVEEVTEQDVKTQGKQQTVTTKMTERIKLVVRAIWPDGQLITFEDQ